MILTVKIEIEKDKDNYQAVVKALEGFDIASVAWEDESKAPEVAVDYKIKSAAKDGDPSATLSAAVDRVMRRRSGDL